MDFRPRETLFFCENFLTLELIGFNFRHEPFHLKRQFCQYGLLTKNRNLGYLSLACNVKIRSVAPSTRVEASL